MRKQKHKAEMKEPNYPFRKIFDNLPDPIFVTDSEGNVLLSNVSTALTLNISLDQLLKSNLRDLVSGSYYSRSYAMEAAKQNQVISGMLKTKLNYSLISTSTPVMGGEFVVTSARPKWLMDAFAEPDSKGQEQLMQREIEHLRNRILETETVVAESPLMKSILHLADSIAKVDSTVILYGETGTGKEVLAKYLYRNSKRSNMPFIAVNCAALPEHLVEAEIFGYEKGAFTGAVTEGKIGLFEAADRGVLFLDEIAELPLNLQSKLLRVIETGEVRRIGSHVSQKINFRLLTATNKNLEKMTREGTFRSDLYYRLNVMSIVIPPLRERPEDIMALSLKFLGDFNDKFGAKHELDPDELAELVRYQWFGNIRELKNEIERRVIYSLHNAMDMNHPGLSLNLAADPMAQINPFKLFGIKGKLSEVLEHVEQKYIERVVKECDGKIHRSAHELGIHRSVLYRKMRAYGQDIW